MLEDIGDTGVPHWNREEVVVRSVEAFKNGEDFVPRIDFSARWCSTAEDRHLGVNPFAGVGGKWFCPQVKRVDLMVGVRLTVRGQEFLSDGARG